MNDWRYTISYVAPITVFCSLYFGGIWSFGSIYVSFIIIPILEFLFQGTEKNHETEQEENRNNSFYFDLLLYSNIPLMLGFLYYYFILVGSGTLAVYELVGLTMSVGLYTGSVGINIGHEFGHRASAFEQGVARFLLIFPLYMHFFIEHNRGHHKRVATDEDPASARPGESIYAFYLRTIPLSYIDAWKLEAQRLRHEGLNAFHWRNEMIWFHFIQLGYVLSVGAYFGWNVVPFCLLVAAMAIWMLENVNYIEHYGLRRKKLPSGRYEPVQPHHSWNSNHDLGRIFLFDVTRHSDHHFKSTRKYQVLRHLENTPQLPYGYPLSILMSFFPWIWFKHMDKQVKAFEEEFAAITK